MLVPPEAGRGDVSDILEVGMRIQIERAVCVFTAEPFLQPQ